MLLPSLILLPLALLPAAFATPTTAQASGCPATAVGNPITADFDCFETDDLANVQSVGTYKSLSWPAMTVGSDNKQVVGVSSFSPPNVAAWGLNGPSLVSPTAAMSIANTSTKSFSLYTLAYGCAAPTEQGTASKGLACTLDISGYDAAGKKIANKTVTYDPKLLPLISPMMRTDLTVGATGKFVDLASCNFTITGLLGEATVGLVDSLNYTIKS